jgi:putative heme degradation protein
MANLLTHIKENAGKLYAFDLAEKLFVTEADLAYARIGYDVTLLSVTMKRMLNTSDIRYKFIISKGLLSIKFI